jgi:hypothetical protein
MHGLWVDAANVVVGEFGAGFAAVLLSFFVVLVVLVLIDGAWGLLGCWGRRAARKKDHFILSMREVLREMGSDIKLDKVINAKWPPNKPR